MVFSTWMAFRGNTHNLGSFGEETDEITDLHQIHEEILFSEHGDSVTAIKRRRRDLSNAYDEPIGDLDMMEDKVDNPCPQKVPIFDEPEPQPQPLPNCPSLDGNLGNEKGPKPPIKPPSLNSFKMKKVDHLTIQTPPSPYVASFHLKDVYYYYRPCINDPKIHYGFKPGLLGQSGSLGVDFLNMEMIKNEWELESKEVSFLGGRLNSPVWPKEVEKVIFDEKKLGSS
ncbi:hypothetical protein Tco_0365570 [Tanacetum coccineum]